MSSSPTPRASVKITQPSAAPARPSAIVGRKPFGPGPKGFIPTILLGLAGSALGWLIFTKGLGIGDDDMFDLGGLVGAVIGVSILLMGYRAVLTRG